MLFFPTRKTARNFASTSDNYKLVDNGTAAEKRWGVKVL